VRLLQHVFELRVRLARGFTKQQSEACGFEVQEMYLALAAMQRAACSRIVKVLTGIRIVPERSNKTADPA
jgi:hypothetical protein